MHHSATLPGVLLVSALFASACGAPMAGPVAPSATTTTTTATPAATGVTISGFTTLSARGERGTLSALVSYTDGSVQDRTTQSTWASGNESVATVNAAGVVTAVGDGHTVVTATFNNVSASKTIMVDLP